MGGLKESGFRINPGLGAKERHLLGAKERHLKPMVLCTCKDA